MFVFFQVLLYYVYRKGVFMLNEMTEEVFNSLKQDLEKAYNHQSSEYAVIRAGRANPHILDKIHVDYYGVPTPIYQMANISVAEARILCISVWDQGQVKNVSKAIAASDIGITPSDDGRVIRLVFPQLTEERRRDITKQVRKIAEDTKVVMRNARRDALDLLKDMKKDGDLSEDELSGCEKDVQKILDGYMAKVDALTESKEKEIMEV